MSEFWRAVKEVNWKPRGINCIDKATWEEFYRGVYPDRLGCDLTFTDVCHPELDKVLSMDELVLALKSCKLNKAPGPHLITNEFWKALPAKGNDLLLLLLNKVFDSGIVPDAWPKAALTMLYKKGQKEDPANYRGIALTNNILKIFTKIIAKRLQSWNEACKTLPESQAGFRQNRGCEDQSFSLITAVQAQLRIPDNSVYAIFVDFRRAFDSVPHNLLWSKLFKIGVSGKIIRCLINLYDKAAAQVKLVGESSAEFGVTEGVLQGEILSPLLYIM